LLLPTWQVLYNVLQSGWRNREAMGSVRNWYSGRRARSYNRVWRTFTDRTLSAALEMIDMQALRQVPERLGRAPRLLDVACGTGILLRRLLEELPEAEAVGIDTSAEMLDQARKALCPWPQARLIQAEVGPEPAGCLPCALETFDLITCTNTLHYFASAAAALSRLGQLLAQDGQLVVEDFARRSPPFPWPAFEWLLRAVDAGHVRAYTLAEARALCQEAGLEINDERAFSVDWLWYGWALRCARA
jgi:ubiquinone/menaquinone biosynthesis C-methylase UbiE